MYADSILISFRGIVDIMVFILNRLYIFILVINTISKMKDEEVSKYRILNIHPHH